MKLKSTKQETNLNELQHKSLENLEHFKEEHLHDNDNLTEQEIKEEKTQKRNLILFSLYKILSYDLLFYYIVSFLFFTEIKHMTASEIIFIDASYPFFKLFIEPLVVTFIDKKPKKLCLISANFALFLSLIVILITMNPLWHILANFLMALGFSIKDQIEATIAYDFITEKNHEKRRSLFLKIDGKSTARHHFFSAISSLTASMIYLINPYLPFVLSASMLLFSTIICFFFKLNKQEHHKKEHQSVKEYINELKESVKFINHSNRLAYLIVYHALFKGMISFMVSYRSSLLTDINVSTTTRGLIFAIFSISAYLSSKKANKLNQKFKNKTLNVFAKTYLLFIIFAGLLAYINNLSPITYLLIYIFMALQYAIEAPYRTIMNQYLSNFTTSKISTKIFSVTGFICQLISLVFMLLASLFLKYFSTSLCFIFIGSGAFILFTILLEKMKNKVGLEPESYDENEIFIKI